MTASKMFNRLLSVLLLVCLLAGFAPAAFAEEPANVEEPAATEAVVPEAEPAELPAAESAAFAVAAAALLPGGNLGETIIDSFQPIELMAPGGSVKCNFYSNPPAEAGVTEESLPNQTVTLGNLSLFAGKFAIDGYKQTGWNTARDGNGQAYALDGTITVASTLYAQWEPDEQEPTYELKPAQPSESLVGTAYVRVYTNDGAHSFDSLSNALVKYAGNVVIGEVEGNDNVGYSCQITVYLESGDELESQISSALDGKYPDEYPEGDWIYDFAKTNNPITFTIYNLSGTNEWWGSKEAVTNASSTDLKSSCASQIAIYMAPPVVTFTVTYTDGVEGEEIFPDETYTVKSGEAMPPFEGTPEREGYTFAGWNTEVAETVTEDVTYTAVWTANTYTVSFAPNGGSAVDPVTVVYDSQYGFYNGNTMRKNLPSADTIDGLQNKGWYMINEDGTLGETSIQKTTYVKTARDHTLFQQREIKVPTVTVTPASISAYYNGEQRTLSASTKEYEGLVYSYQWYKNGEPIEGATDKDLVLDGNVADSGTYKVVVTVTKGAELAEVITVNESAAGEKDVTVTIRKIANTIQYDANGGEGGPVNNFSNVTYATVQLGQPTREGYTFTGWNTEADGSGDSYKGGDVYTFEGDVGNGGQKVILYAQWSANEYLLHVNPANGEDVYDVTITYEDVVGDKVAEPVWAGHTFTGWVDQDGESVDQEALYTEALESIIATWKLNEYVVPVDPANGEDVTDVTYTYEDVIGDKYDFSKDPTRKGYTFQGWVDQDGNPVDLKATYTEDIQSINGSWKGKTYTVTFKLEEDEGTLSFTEKKVVNGDPLGYTPKVEREGYTFIGWYDENGKYYNSETIFDAARDITLTGRWTKTVVPTGDDSDPALFALMMLGSLACAGAILIRLRKREDQV